jgi:hypothetical protein
MNIIDLQEVSHNVWKAKYRGNYGIYTIKVKKDGDKTVDFSCSCPSSYYPCKHIPIMEAAIRERIAKSRKNDDKHEITIDLLLKDLSQKELCDFIIKQAQYNPQLKNAILLEFTRKVNKTGIAETNNYTQLLQDALDEVYLDDEDVEYGHYEGILEIEILEKWLDKAKEYADTGNPKEAMLICKAIIEEYASWCDEQDDYIVEYVDINYQERPFDILNQIYPMPEIDNKELIDYCKSEISKPKYRNTKMYNGFNMLLMKLSVKVGSDDFIMVQDKLLQEVDSKSSSEAGEILQRKINFYRSNKQPNKAWDIIKENLQIESFRNDLTKKLIAEDKLQEAKKLIDDFITKNKEENSHTWLELKLQIAQKEENTKEIQRISYAFIESRFDDKYYNIYKSTFAQEEWTEQVEKLIRHYEKRHNNNWFNNSVANVLQSEKQEERLLKYIEKHLQVDILKKYYAHFSSSFPEKTLSLFRQVIDEYAQNTGREYYEHIVRLFGEMVKIKGGSELVKEMITQYRSLYKNRKAMMEIINRF